jgi:activator of HSP90 ATPase
MIRNENRSRAPIKLSRRYLILAGTVAASAMLIKPRSASAESDGISRTAESIHQEITFAANPNRVYEALTQTKRFDRVVQLSGVMQSAALAQMKKPTEVSRLVGGAFSAFGGYINGRQVELVPSALIVQAWRAESWDRDVYSIAKFVLMQHDTGTRLVFDHTGFPVGQAEHLASGWKEHYWDPLNKYLSEG